MHLVNAGVTDQSFGTFSERISELLSLLGRALQNASASACQVGAHSTIVD